MSKVAWRVDDIPQQDGRIALVTGANSGIGFQEAKYLAQKGATVILAGRHQTRLTQAVTRIRQTLPTAKLATKIIDLADLNSIKRAASDMRQQYSHLDLLLNNAGIMMPPLLRTKQGFESQFGTNYLGHFALTGRLLPLILSTPNSRIISMTSLASRLGRIDLKDLNYRNRRYHKLLAYGQSKLANLMFIHELSQKLAAANVTTKALVAHPGGANTNLMNNGGVVLRRIITPLGSQPVTEAALPILRAATDPNSPNGSFWGPAGTFGLKGTPIQLKFPGRAENETVSRQLWAISERLTEINYGKRLIRGSYS